MDEAHAVELKAMGEDLAAELRAAMIPASASASAHRRRGRSPAVDVARFPVVAGAPNAQAE
jgi:hypothetical protein